MHRLPALAGDFAVAGMFFKIRCNIST